VTSEDAALEAIGALGDPVRRALYRFVAAAPGETGRDAAAESVGISRSLAAFHLDKLVEAELLAVSFRRLSGRTGPGAGRPAKLYRRAVEEHAVTLPPRSYDTMSRMLAEVVDHAGLDRELHAAARAAGAAQGAASGSDTDPIEALRSRGYQPFRDDTTLRLRNCPFHALARDFPPLVCGMNLALVQGLLDGLPGGTDWEAVLEPRPELCCVALKSKTDNG
jgi:predicted ArsR family transcriptional regulator